MKSKGSMHWLKIGILIGVGIMLVQFLLPLGLLALLLSPFLLLALACALFYTKIRDYLILRSAWAERNKRMHDA